MRRLLLLIPATFSTAVAGQDFSMPVFVDQGFLMQQTGQDVTSQIVAMEREQASGSTTRDRGTDKTKGQTVRPPSALAMAPAGFAVLSYDVSLTRRAANLRSFVEKSRAANPSGAADLERVFASGDVIQQLDGEMRKYGLRADNLADAYALWWINAWEAATGAAATEDRGVVAAVRRQSAIALSNVPDVAKADDTIKQNLAEALMVQAMLVSALNEKYRTDKTHGPQLRKAAAQGAKSMSLDLKAMELTPDGFVMRKGASAADAPAGPLEEREVVAAAQVEEEASSDTVLATYALPLLGGSIALAAVFFLGGSAGVGD